ncbi:MAG TPA: hypothetical protein VJ728_12770 [Candidatus Binataceae bacterium]|nr:hypothetical protein [Candidatus Binataceae bacterium]
MTKLSFRLLTALFTVSLLANAGAADVPIGYLSWDVTTPGLSGQFDVSNQTGPNSSVSPDATWPVTNSINLSSLSLRVDFSDGTSQAIPSYFSLSADGISLTGKAIPIGPGNRVPIDATLTGSLSPTTLTLNNGSNVAVNNSFSVSVSDRPILTDGDLAVLNATSGSGPTPTPTITPTPGATGVRPTPAVSISGAAGVTVGSGTFILDNNSGATLVTPTVTISFDNADLFSSATLTTTVGSTTSTATVNPLTGGDSPEQPNNTVFVLHPVPVIPNGQAATYSLTVTITSHPEITRRDRPMMYAAIFGENTPGSNGWLIALLLFEGCAAGMTTFKRKRLLVALVMLLAMASQVGCDNGSTPGPPAPSGVIQSTQTAVQLDAVRQIDNSPVTVTGLPALMGTIKLK